ncbi:MAG: hypothetical protein GC165_06080 [Armatimonadetes bacterium]|nr:hypothetical protein [Armatimonadota bacterium]
MIPTDWLDALASVGSLTDKQLQNRFGAEASRWARQQEELRKKARAKFAEADTMLFDREALEQATHEAIARYHASRFPLGAKVVDLTCGIGSDLHAFGSGAVGFEIDALRAEYARHNCPLTEVRTEDGLAYAQSSSDPYLWADPDRRDSSGRRLADPSQYAPNPLDIPRDRQLTGIKLSPMLADEFLAEVGPRVEFVSFRGECREAVVWAGKLAEAGIFAVRIETGATLGREPTYDQVDEAGEFIFDADPAAVRAHALGGFDRPQLGDSPGYVTGGDLESEWLTPYRVLAAGTYDAKRIKEALRNLGRRVFEVKQRGAGVEPTAVMRQVRTDGDPASLICWRVGKSVRWALAERVGRG